MIGLHFYVRWLFIIEGSITMFIGLITIFILPDFPHNSRGFTAEERKLAVLRMTEDAGESDSDDTSALKALAGAFTDHRLYVMALTLVRLGAVSSSIRQSNSCFVDFYGHWLGLQCLFPDSHWYLGLRSHRDFAVGCATIHIRYRE